MTFTDSAPGIAGAGLGHFVGPDERHGLYALHVLLENLTEKPQSIGPASAELMTDLGERVPGDVLVEVDSLLPGEIVEGWVAFFIEESDSPTTVRWADSTGHQTEQPLDRAKDDSVTHGPVSSEDSLSAAYAAEHEASETFSNLT